MTAPTSAQIRRAGTKAAASNWGNPDGPSCSALLAFHNQLGGAMGTKTLGAAAAVLALAIPGTALAADPPFPLLGKVHDTVENGWMTYDCDLPEGGLLTCRFTQIKIMRQTSTEDAAKKKATLAADITDGVSTEEWSALCELAAQLSNIGAGQAPANATAQTRRAVERATPVMRRDATAQAAALTEACQTRSTGALQRFFDLGVGLTERTCVVNTNSFTQTFRAHFNTDGSFASWNIADTRPQGDCGFIQLSRFVPVMDKPGQKPYLWQYYARRVTSNRQATSMLGKCSDFEEFETLYDWISQPIFLQCDYVEAGY